MKYSERMMPLMAIGIGVFTFIPLFFSRFEEDSWQWKLCGGMFLFAVIFITVLFRRIGKNYPKLYAYSAASSLNAAIILSVGGFLATSISVIYAMLPVPLWLHLIIGVGIIGCAFWFLTNSGKENEASE